MFGKRSRRKRSLVGRIALGIAGLIATYYAVCTVLLILYAFVYPPVTGVQLQRMVESLAHGDHPVFDYHPVPLSKISGNLGHAAIAAEDGRFYEHNGVDWQAVQKAVKDNERRGRIWRGGSTITQQLVKNLFMTTHSSFIRKGFEIPLAYIADLILPKKRILALYLNVIEWGRGIYGAEAAARHYYGTSAAHLSRYQSASLAAVIPSPRRRSPSHMGRYTSVILGRMQQMGY